LARVSTGPDRQSHRHEQDDQESRHLAWRTRWELKGPSGSGVNGADAERVNSRANQTTRMLPKVNNS
jgi:hypothetical protein